MASKKTGKQKMQGPGQTPRLVGGDGDDAQPCVLHPCVVLASASQQQLTDAFHTALLEEGLVPRVEHDPRMAMAEVCLLRREAKQRRGTGADRSTAAPLILLDLTCQLTNELIAAMRQHVPDIPVLHFDGTSLNTVHKALDAATKQPPVIVQPPRSIEVNEDELMSLLRSSTTHDKASNS
ncbi:MAG: hypothetical protein P8I91_04860 [Phycisphaerales bacterium]|jgi:DNA-binding PucR family transcriptional regulator|nr:hypothetical protein [Phycisphaerales bacterium]